MYPELQSSKGTLKECVISSVSLLKILIPSWIKVEVKGEKVVKLMESKKQEALILFLHLHPTELLSISLLIWRECKEWHFKKG